MAAPRTICSASMLFGASAKAMTLSLWACWGVLTPLLSVR
ncbi:hypothetical protein [Streptomyces chartreusis]